MKLRNDFMHESLLIFLNGWYPFKNAVSRNTVGTRRNLTKHGWMFVCNYRDIFCCWIFVQQVETVFNWDFQKNLSLTFNIVLLINHVTMTKPNPWPLLRKQTDWHNLFGCRLCLHLHKLLQTNSAGVIARGSFTSLLFSYVYLERNQIAKIVCIRLDRLRHRTPHALYTRSHS